ncbi:hypothetical protein C0992_005533 [Termitomyces sp. T32_za158]|nr:hypothetical protein C0992_005533 [Termitomyces sp. T32_za158]
MDMVFTIAGIGEARDRKNKVLDYVDAQTEVEWRGFKTFKNNTASWDDFVKEIVKSYPEALDGAGSVTVLDKICKTHTRMGTEDRPEINSFIRKFRAQAAELMEDKGVYGNGQLVQKFLKCFKPSFSKLVLLRALQIYGHHASPARKRHKDNKYDLDEIIEVVQLVLEDALDRDKDEFERREKRISKDIKVNTEPAETEETMANLQDSVMAMGKEIKSYTQTLQQTLQQEFRSMAQALNTRHSMGQATQASYNNISQTAGSLGRCFHCWEPGHRHYNCPHMKRQVAEGKLILVDGKPRLKNGDSVPPEPTTISPKDRIELVADQKAESFYNWSTNPTSTSDIACENITFSMFTNTVRDSRDDMIERLSQEREGIREEFQAKMDESCATFISTRSTATAEEVQQHNSKDF